MTAEKGGEFRGKTIEAAIGVGLTALGMSRDQVEIEVVRAGSRGLLGIGAEDAVVRLTARTAVRAEPAVSPAAKPEPLPTAKTEPVQAVRSEPRPQGRQAPRPKSTPRVEPQAGPGEAGAERTDEEAIERGRALLAELLDHMGMRAQVEIVPQSEAESDTGERAMVLNIVGDDLGSLIGRQSEVLSSLQFITRLMVNQQTRSRCNLIVDVNGYKAKRAESLRKLAVRTAEQVMQTGRTMALEPMPPAERRIIHLALRNHPSVTTQSVGEGSKRKVTVVPKKQ